MKILYICEKPYSGKTLAKNLVALNLSEPFEDHGHYLESDKFVIGWAYGHLFQLRKTLGVTDDAALMESELEAMRQNGSLTPDWPFEPADPVFFKDPNGLFQVLKALIHRDDVEFIVHAGDPGPDEEINIRVILRMAEADKPIYRLSLFTTREDELREKKSKLLSPISIGEENAVEGFRNMYFNFRRGNVQLHLGNMPKDQALTSEAEGLAQTLRKLTTGGCCKVCRQRGVCLDAELEQCPAFSPSENFVKRLKYWL
jgi:hypothetical protein